MSTSFVLGSENHGSVAVAARLWPGSGLHGKSVHDEYLLDSFANGVILRYSNLRFIVISVGTTGMPA